MEQVRIIMRRQYWGDYKVKNLVSNCTRNFETHDPYHPYHPYFNLDPASVGKGIPA